MGQHDCSIPKHEGPTYDFDDIRNMYGFPGNRFDPQNGPDYPSDEDIANLADQLDDLSRGADLEDRIAMIIPKEADGLAVNHTDK